MASTANRSATKDVPDEFKLAGIDHFAQFVSGTKVPPRNKVLATSRRAAACKGLFETIGFAGCPVSAITTASSHTVIDGGEFVMPTSCVRRLGGLRTRPRFMHDLRSLTLKDVIERHPDESERVIHLLRELTQKQRKLLLTFLDSL